MPVKDIWTILKIWKSFFDTVYVLEQGLWFIFRETTLVVKQCNCCMCHVGLLHQDADGCCLPVEELLIMCLADKVCWSLDPVWKKSPGLTKSRPCCGLPLYSLFESAAAAGAYSSSGALPVCLSVLLLPPTCCCVCGVCGVCYYLSKMLGRLP